MQTEHLAEEAAASALVIFGASGDLTRRKLFPALYNLALAKALPSGFAAIGVARRPKTDESFADEMKEGVQRYSRSGPVDEDSWSALARGIAYVAGTFEAPETYAALKARLSAFDASHGTSGSRVYYLAVAPQDVLGIVRALSDAGLLPRATRDPHEPFTRVVVEKPFGEDKASAQALSQQLYRYIDESQLYRIDHYLGKETIQNLIVLRFGNAIFEPLWNRNHVSHVEITVAEDIGIEGRGKFYERVGITRDIVQNHLLQLLTIVAMEPPVALDADAIRDEKVKVLRSIRPLSGEAVSANVVRGQYKKGQIGGQKVPGYREEPDVARDSTTDTFVAMRLFLDSWRWAGVPFFVRAGKRLSKRVAEVAVHFRAPPLSLFRGPSFAQRAPNSLVIRVQPDESMELRFDTKVPGAGMAMEEAAMAFQYQTAFGGSSPEAYERLILDALRGDATLFTRADEVEAQWGFIDPILHAWRKKSAPISFYESGTMGPVEADQLVATAGFTWRRP